MHCWIIIQQLPFSCCVWVSTYEKMNHKVSVNIFRCRIIIIIWLGLSMSYMIPLVIERLRLLLTTKNLQTISSWQVGRVIFPTLGLYHVVIRVFIKRLKAQSEYHDSWLNGEKRMCTIKASIIFLYSHFSFH